MWVYMLTYFDYGVECVSCFVLPLLFLTQDKLALYDYIMQLMDKKGVTPQETEEWLPYSLLSSVLGGKRHASKTPSSGNIHY